MLLVFSNKYFKPSSWFFLSLVALVAASVVLALLLGLPLAVRAQDASDGDGQTVAISLLQLKIQSLEGRLREQVGANEEIQAENQKLKEQIERIRGDLLLTINTINERLDRRMTEIETRMTYSEQSLAVIRQGRSDAAVDAVLGVDGSGPKSTDLTGAGLKGDKEDGLAAIDRSLPEGTSELGRVSTSALLPDDQETIASVEREAQYVAPAEDAVAASRVKAVPISGDVEAAATKQEIETVPDIEPEALYAQAFSQLQQQRFDDAEELFNVFLSRFPEHSLAGNSQYWIGETAYARGDYAESVNAFVDVFAKFPDSRKVPDSLLKLSLSLKALGRKEAACTALRELRVLNPQDRLRVLMEREYEILSCPS